MNTVKLQAPDGASGVSVDGEDYRVDRGVIEVPASVATVLRSHGYTTYVPKPNAGSRLVSSENTAETKPAKLQKAVSGGNEPI